MERKYKVAEKGKTQVKYPKIQIFVIRFLDF